MTAFVDLFEPPLRNGDDRALGDCDLLEYQLTMDA
jgi:hypothetical protein